MENFHLILWKEFDDKKLLDRQEIINVEDANDGLNKIKGMNAQKRLTTTDYRVINLTEVLKDHSLQITELVLEEKTEETKDS